MSKIWDRGSVTYPNEFLSQVSDNVIIHFSLSVCYSVLILLTTDMQMYMYIQPHFVSMIGIVLILIHVYLPPYLSPTGFHF